MKIKARLVLADGTVFEGVSVGASCSSPVVGEVVFNTSMYGYQEILTDPSYAGQLLCFTNPQIGNVGCNKADNESDKVHARGVIIRDNSKVVSNFRAEQSFNEFLVQSGCVGIAGIDTRALVSHLRDFGSQMGVIGVGPLADNVESLVAAARAAGSMEGKDYVREVTCKTAYEWFELPWSLSVSKSLDSHQFPVLSKDELGSRPHIVVIDCGVKKSMLRLLLEAGFRITVAPATASVEHILELCPDALFVSNGPGDPAAIPYVVEPVKKLIGKIPMFGICLGHQIIGQALGSTTYKLKFGHRGGNHPVLDKSTGKVEITVQNHGFAVVQESIPRDVSVSHINLNDQTVEGLSVPDLGIMAVQYHPEASPGPHDSAYLFHRFYRNVTASFHR